MSDVVLKVENLYKEYRLGVISHGTLFRDLQSWWARVRGKEDPNSLVTSRQHSAQQEDDAELKQHFLALDNVSFEVKQGDILGVIGKNGAGKSTLLKVLSRITAPTAGSVKIKGRIASLLEVGTGFHPELTGRENVFMNGAILGMRRGEIAQKMDEIIAFAGLEKFIDTPVKRYSSGMYVRLAFAVAAHLDAEILLMDEVLAVGDAEFQKKALGKMGDVAKSGRTVLFVSHNMGAVKALCHRAIILERGSLKRVYEKINAAVADYLGNNNNSQTTWQNDGELSDVNFTPHRVYLVNKFYQPIEEINNAENVCLCLECDIKIIDHLLNVGISLSQLDGTVIFASWLKDIHTPELKTGKNVFYIELPTKNLNNGQYKITLSAGLHHVKYCINLGCEPSIDFTINNVLNTEFGDMERGGIYTPLIAWRTEL